MERPIQQAAKLLQPLSQEDVSEIALNIIEENDGVFAFNTEAGINKACQYAVDFYAASGHELKHDEIKIELVKQMNTSK